MRAPRGFLSPPQGTTPLPPVPRPDPYPQHRQAAAPGAPHCACPIHGSLLHRWGRGGGGRDCCSWEGGQDMAQGVLLAQHPVPTQSRDQGAVGLGETPRGSRRVGVCVGWLPLESPCERCAQHHGEGRRAWASREGSAAPSPRWTPHIPSFPAKKTDCEGLDTHWCCEVSPPPILGDLGGTSHGQLQG